MKNINWKIRLKQPYFWIGLFGVLFTATGLDATTLTTWESVWIAFTDFWKNPYMIVSVGLALVGVICDPTTSGFGDSVRALNYATPNKDEKYTRPSDIDDELACQQVITSDTSE